MNKTTKANRGFTLTELLMTLSIASILLTLGIPSMGTYVSNSSSKQAFSRLQMDLIVARNKAIARGETVRITPAVGGFSQGWTVQAYSGDPLVAGDVLRQRDALDDRVSIDSDEFPYLTPIGFTASGQLETSGTLAITASGCTGNNARNISLMASGQIAFSEVACL